MTRSPSPLVFRLARGVWRLALAGFFRRIEVEGAARIPRSGPALLVANHTNALVDGLILLTRLDRPLTLTAKATLARNPLLRLTMRALGVVPLRRASDAARDEGPERNAEALVGLRRRLEAGGVACIFPEGISHSDPALRPFRTGAARLALDFLDAAGSALPIVPIGLHYDRKEAFRSTAAVLVGEPFDAAAWRRAHPAADARELTAEIERRIRALTANFERRSDSLVFTHAAELLETEGRAPAPLGREAAEVAARLELVHRLQAGAERLRLEQPDRLAALEVRVRHYRRDLAHAGVAPAELWLELRAGRAAFFALRELELLLVGGSLALWGALNSMLPYRAVRALVRRLSVDRDQFASNAVFLAVPIFALAWAVQGAVAALLLPPLGVALYLVSVPYAGAVALLYRDRAGGAWRRARTFMSFLREPAERRRLQAEARDIAREIRGLARGIEPDA